MRWVAIAFLAVGCGGQVDETEPEPACHEVRGYFADQRCSERISFDSCEPPEFVFAVQDFRCTLVQP